MLRNGIIAKPITVRQVNFEMVDEALPQPAPEPIVADPPRRILVVDDDQDQLEALAYRLQRLGYDPSSASSGQQAIEAATSDVPDLVLLDVCLPDVNGFDVCEQLGDAPATCGIPVIILSGLESDDIVRQARSAGCAYYLRKPYDPNVLLTLIQNAIDSAMDLDW
jgi:CheY-like chemotaxis protein